MEWPIQELARVAGTTSRALRHYGDLGLLTPSRTGSNGYRYYDSDALVRLQRILLLRELGLGLTAIARVLDGQQDPAAALRDHLDLLKQERARLGRQIESVTTTLRKLDGGEQLMAEEVFAGFDNSQYEREVTERWGQVACDDGNHTWAALGSEGQRTHKVGLESIAAGLAEAGAAGEEPGSDRVQALVQRHYDWVRVFWTPGRDAYIGLGRMYAGDQRFAAGYDRYAPGTAVFLREAIKIYAERGLRPLCPPQAGQAGGDGDPPGGPSGPGPVAGIGSGRMTPKDRWFAALWPFVRGGLPAPPESSTAPAVPVRVLEIGCGPLGGFGPMLSAAGYAATGVDPEAPDGPGFHRVEFERYDLPEPVDAIVACTSLHHVGDLGEVIRLVDAALVPGGAVVVVEWAREDFNEATARWCFSRLTQPASGEGADDEDHAGSDSSAGWLSRQRDEWQASGLGWGDYLRSWVDAEGLHAGQAILRELDSRLRCEHLDYGPYFFADLAETSEADEQAAIDAGRIRANRIRYLGRRA